MRWLLLHPSDELYGADRVLLEVVDAFAPDVHECWLPTDVPYPQHLLCRALAERGVMAAHRPMPVLRRKYMTAAGLFRLGGRALRSVPTAIAIRSDVDRVYLNTSAVLPMAPLLQRRHRLVVAHIHESWGPTERRLLGPLLRFCDRVIAVSDAVADTLPHDSTVVHNGFPDLQSVPSPPSDRNRLNVLLASRWSNWKGHREFLHAWQQAAREDAHLTIVGGPPPAGEGVDVPALIADLGLQQSVTVLPERADISDLLDAANLIVVPSVKPDPLPTIAIEAARAGRAVLASSSGGLPEIVSDGVSGWLAPPGDRETWAAILRRISPDEAAARGRSARDVFTQKFGTRRFADELRAVAYD